MVREEMGRSVPFRIGRSGEIELQCRWFAGITLPNRSQPHISPNFSLKRGSLNLAQSQKSRHFQIFFTELFHCWGSKSLQEKRVLELLQLKSPFQFLLWFLVRMLSGGKKLQPIFEVTVLQLKISKNKQIKRKKLLVIMVRWQKTTASQRCGGNKMRTSGFGCR